MKQSAQESFIKEQDILVGDWFKTEDVSPVSDGVYRENTRGAQESSQMTNTWVCECGSSHPFTHKFCNRCGRPIPQSFLDAIIKEETHAHFRNNADYKSSLHMSKGGHFKK